MQRYISYIFLSIMLMPLSAGILWAASGNTPQDSVTIAYTSDIAGKILPQQA